MYDGGRGSHERQPLCEYASRLEVCTGVCVCQVNKRVCEAWVTVRTAQLRLWKASVFLVKGPSALGGSLGEWTHMCSLASPVRLPLEGPVSPGLSAEPQPHKAQLTAPCPALFSASAEGGAEVGKASQASKIGKAGLL